MSSRLMSCGCCWPSRRPPRNGCWTEFRPWRSGCRAPWRCSDRGWLRQSKVTIIVDVTVSLDDDEARAAEEQVLGRAHRLTPACCATRSPKP
jgi:hypothetical protein